MAKFCSKCGSPLIGGQPCSCQSRNVQQPFDANYGNGWQDSNYVNPQSSYQQPANPVQPQFRQPEPERYFNPQRLTEASATRKTVKSFLIT